MSKHALNELGIDPVTFEVLRNGRQVDPLSFIGR